MEKLKFAFILNGIVLLCACNQPNEAKSSEHLNITHCLQPDTALQQIVVQPVEPPPPPPLPPPPLIAIFGIYSPPNVIRDSLQESLSVLKDSLREILSIKDDTPNGMAVYTKNAVPPPVVCIDTVRSNHKDIQTIVEQMPEFPTGEVALFKYLSDSLRYPQVALDSGIAGKVYIRFGVDTTGAVTQIEVRKGLGGGCSEEAVRLIRAMPRWIPGKQGGKLVKVFYTLPVQFNLER
jgi:periplasmic protein TonB